MNCAQRLTFAVNGQPVASPRRGAASSPSWEGVAEGVGFEPTVLSYNGFQDRRLKPLGHPSIFRRVQRRASAGQRDAGQRTAAGLLKPLNSAPPLTFAVSRQPFPPPGGLLPFPVKGNVPCSRPKFKGGLLAPGPGLRL